MLKMIMYCIVLSLSLLVNRTSFGITESCRLTVAAEKNGLMGPIGKGGEHQGPAKIFGKSVIVPAFQLRFVNDSGEAVVPSEINITYG